MTRMSFILVHCVVVHVSGGLRFGLHLHRADSKRHVIPKFVRSMSHSVARCELLLLKITVCSRPNPALSV